MSKGASHLMPSDLLDPNAVEITPAHSSLRLVPPIKPKVLIVEDYDDSREVLRLLLEMKNWCVTEARDGLEAVEMAVRVQPDVILMDGGLPLIDGFEATRRIRKNKLLREVFILAMNGWGTPSYHEAALAAGCNDSLSKPIDFDRLESLLVPFFHKAPCATVSTKSGKDEPWAKARSPHLFS
jgi:two-component system cell cycle response regulator DivK